MSYNENHEDVDGEYVTPAPLTAEDWLDRVYEVYSDRTMLMGYMKGVEYTVAVLEKMAESAKTFEELKEELLKFNKQQQAFLKDVTERWLLNENCKQEYDLPRPGYKDCFRYKG